MAAAGTRSPLMSAIFSCWCVGVAIAVGVQIDMPVHEVACRWVASSVSELLRRGTPSKVVSPQDSVDLIKAASDIMWRDISSIPRATMFLEVFSGASETTALCNSKWGMVAYSIEKLRGPSQDVCTAMGLLYAMYLLASLSAGSLCHLSPQCSTWLDMCRWRARRSRDDTEGDLRRADVVQANHCAAFVSSGCYKINPATPAT